MIVICPYCKNQRENIIICSNCNCFLSVRLTGGKVISTSFRFNNLFEIQHPFSIIETKYRIIDYLDGHIIYEIEDYRSPEIACVLSPQNAKETLKKLLNLQLFV
jgi:hypothetical protein